VSKVDFIDILASFANMNILLVFGICLMFGVLGGMIANRITWMPTITAFMLLGFIIGPYGLGLISKRMMADSGVFIEIALGLILYKLGNMLHLKAMLRSRRLMMLALAESTLSFAAVAWAGVFLGLPLLVAGAIAAISVSSSPAVLVHVAEEMRAKGPVSDRAKSLVAINNLVAFILFSALMPFMIAGGEKTLSAVIGFPLYRLAGALFAGVVIAWVAARITRMLGPHDEHYRFAIVIGAVMMVMGVCKTIGASALLAPLILGVAIRSFETSRHNLSKVGLGEGGDLFFIVLFVMAGAKINIAELYDVAAIAVILVVVRSLAKAAGIYGAGAINKMDLKQSGAISMMLLPMAGMAIGLVTTTHRLAPEVSESLATIVFAMVAIFETIGPILVARALKMTGEAGRMDDKSGDGQAGQEPLP
jgi:Kef-type K+ transport system membrane component KefB